MTVVQALGKCLSVLTKVLPFVKRFSRERGAAKGGTALSTDITRNSVEELLDQFAGGGDKGPVWKEWKAKLQNAAIGVSEQFSVTAMHEWLKDAEVREAFYFLIQQNIANRSLSRERLELIRARYSTYTGERQELAEGHVQTVLDVFTARIKNRIETVSAVGAATTILQAEQRASKEEIISAFEAGNERLTEKLTRRSEELPIQERRHRERENAECRHEFDILVLHRDLDDDQIHDLLKQAVQRLSAEWISVDDDLKIKILHFAALMHCDSVDHLPFAKQCRETILDIDKSADIARVDAAILFCEDKAEDAMKILQNHDTPSARSQLLLYLFKSRDPASVTEWMETMGNKPPWDLLTYAGWNLVALARAGGGEWKEALHLLDDYCQSTGQDNPRVIGLRALLSVGMLFPAEYRDPESLSPLMLSHDIFWDTDEARQYRAKALSGFTEYENVAATVGVDDATGHARQWRACLLLSDKQQRAAGEQLVRDSFSDTGLAWALLPIARAFEIDVNIDGIQADLKRRRLIGQSGVDEQRHQLLLHWYQQDYRGIVELLDGEQGSILKDAIGVRQHVSFLIEALVRVGNLRRAEVILGEHCEILEDDAARFELMIDQARGNNILEAAIKRFEETDSDLDLSNLCAQLAEGREFAILRPYATAYFKRHKNQSTLLRLVQCLFALNLDSDLMELFNENPTLLEDNQQLKFYHAHTLYNLGRPHEAQNVLDQLQGETPLSITFLGINIALHEGDRAKARRLIEALMEGDRLKLPKDTLQTAMIASRLDRSLAYSLLSRAVEAAPEDPHVLSGAGFMAINIGFDDQGIAWTHRALKFSTSDGPIRGYTMKETIEMYLEHGKRMKSIDDMMAKAEIPLHLYCTAKDLSLSLFIVALATQNQVENDARRKSLITIRHGGRSAIDMSSVTTITMDITALLVAETFGVFEWVEKSFDKVLLPWGTLALLLLEEYKAEFHQPSRIKSARSLLDILSQGVIQIASVDVDPPSWLIDEIGLVDAMLLEYARKTDGLFVAHLPKHKAGSLEFADADLRDYANIAVSPIQLIKYLQRDGRLVEADADNAIQTLQASSISDGPDIDDVPPGPWYLDGLTINALHRCGLLKTLATARKLYAHSEFQADLVAFASIDENSSTVRDVLSQLQARIRTGLSRGTMEYLPRVVTDEDADGDSDRYDLVPLLSRFGDAHAIWIDDRMMSASMARKDSVGIQALVVGIVDVLSELRNRGVVSDEQRFRLLIQLRQAGLVVLPIEHAEVRYWLDRAKIDAVNGALLESAELAIIRRYYRRTLSASLLQMPDEASLVMSVRGLVLKTITEYWKDTSISVDTAAVMSSWLFRHLFIGLVDFQHLMVRSLDADTVSDARAADVTVILNIALQLPHERREAFSQWMEDQVLSKYLLSNGGVLNEAASYFMEIFTSKYG